MLWPPLQFHKNLHPRIESKCLSKAKNMHYNLLLLLLSFCCLCCETFDRFAPLVSERKNALDLNILK